MARYEQAVPGVALAPGKAQGKHGEERERRQEHGIAAQRLELLAVAPAEEPRRDAHGEEHVVQSHRDGNREAERDGRSASGEVNVARYGHRTGTRGVR